MRALHRIKLIPVSLLTLFIAFLLLFTSPALASVDTINKLKQPLQTLHQPFFAVGTCAQDIVLAEHQYFLCSPALRNDGNAPFVLLGKTQSPTVVLVHGLSDSPFYLHSIAQFLNQQGYTVIVGLLPGHGLTTNSEQVLHDNELRAIWRNYVDGLIDIAHQLSAPVVVGGFSTGGALMTDLALRQPTKVDGLLLFSGALRLADNVESLSKIPFIKYIAKVLDGDYPESVAGPSNNPYKYPNVSSYAALVLMDIIRNIRDGLLNSTGLTLPIYSAHSQFDETTPISGIDELLAYTFGEHIRVDIDVSMKVCHAAVPLATWQVEHIGVEDKNSVVPCDSPEHNPIHEQMLAMLGHYMKTHFPLNNDVTMKKAHTKE